MTNSIGLLIVYFIAGYIVVSFIFSVMKIKKSNTDTNNKETQEEKETNNYTKKEWYQILEIEKTSTIEEIKKAYRNKMKEYHPDRVAGLGKEFSKLAEEKSKEINMAYEEAIKAKR